MTKIEALEKTIYNVENDIYDYSWQSLASCNCGVLARTVLGGRTAPDAGYFGIPSVPQMPSQYDLFSDRTHCLNTGIKLPLVYQALENCGFTDQEMKYLEFLNDPKILERVEGGELIKDRKQSLLRYLHAWIELLQEPKQKPERVKTVYVSVPETIKEQTTELILS